MLSLVYDPDAMTTDEAADLAAPLGIGHLIARRGEAWHVENRTWSGHENIGRPNRRDIDALPEPPPHPAAQAVERRRETEAMFDDLGTLDPREMQEGIADLVKLLGSGKASEADTAIANVLLDVIRYLLQRGRA